MQGFTRLETTILEAICDDHAEIAEALRAILATARVTGRENTGHGFFTDFEVDWRGPPPIPWAVSTLSGPNAQVQAGRDVLEMGFHLSFLDSGYPDCLEGYQWGTSDGRDIDLQLHDLAALRFIRRTP